MEHYTRLSGAEFEVMKTIWESNAPTSSKVISSKLEVKHWKPQTILTLLARLVNKKFLKCEKEGNKNIYYPLIVEQNYVQYETDEFIKKFHHDSIKELVNTLYDSKELTKEEIYDLKKYLDDLVK